MSSFYGSDLPDNAIRQFLNKRQEYRVARNAKDYAGAHAAKLAAKSLQYASGIRRARAFVDSTGAVGFGRYRKYNRYGYRRNYKWRSRRHSYRGRGFYKGFLGDAGGVAGRAIGGIWGHGNTGGNIGRAAGSWLSRKIGWGAYGDAPDMENVIAAKTPLITNTGELEGVITMRKREYIGEVRNTGSGFQILYDFSLNPGDPSVCPWLASIAVKFERYKFVGCMFHFETTSGDNVSFVGLGEIMGAQYDNVNTDAPIAKIDMAQTDMYSSSRPDRSCTWGIECDPNLKNNDWRYVRSGVGSNQSAARNDQTDLCRWILACNGIPQANSTLGSLYITYEVMLSSPINRRQTELGTLLSSAMLANRISTVTSVFSQITPRFDNMGAVLHPSAMFGAAAYMTFPKQLRGTFLINIYMSGPSRGGVYNRMVVGENGCLTRQPYQAVFPTNTGIGNTEIVSTEIATLGMTASGEFISIYQAIFTMDPYQVVAGAQPVAGIPGDVPRLRFANFGEANNNIHQAYIIINQVNHEFVSSTPGEDLTSV